MKESRNRDNNTKKTEYILNERCKFKKKLSMTKKRKENFFKIFCLKINFPKILAPPIFVTQIFAPQYLGQVYAGGATSPHNLYRQSHDFACGLSRHKVIQCRPITTFYCNKQGLYTVHSSFRLKN